MIRTSKHNLTQFSNQGKLNSLGQMFIDYKIDLEYYINLILTGVLPLQKMLSSSQLPANIIKHSWYKQILYKQASEIVRSQTKQSSEKRFYRYQKIYSYFKQNGRQEKFIDQKYSELNLKPLFKSKYFTKPSLINISIDFDYRFFDIQFDSSFDNIVRLTLPYLRSPYRALTVKLPFNNHKHSNKLKNAGFTLRRAIQLKKINNKYILSLVWEKPDAPKQVVGKTIGLDTGYRKLIATSDNQILGSEMINIYQNIVSKKRNSKSYKRELTKRDQMINYYINQIDLDGVKTLVIEDLLNVKYKSQYTNKTNDLLSRWTYRPLIKKLEMICEVKGIELVKVSPAYTSQTCSSCGSIHEESRNGDNFKCVDCGYEIDVDYNASINICNRGVIVPLTKEG